MWLSFSLIRFIGDINCSNVNVVKSLRTWNFTSFATFNADITKPFDTCKMVKFEADSFELNRESSEFDQRRRR